ncbi:putative Ig domain-containing protein [Cohnella herbarum]|uniref:Uncharacterized protein n=1 Tax=Cohnella herbarum TaxID=2728023 RepID=A0A7Z2VNP8_9BACL|nr:putative Ig domain-containing protein [Cohnella herbarum]QJD86294.1 hypothetical protein HH215_26075 [Cohnella herbarum]
MGRLRKRIPYFAIIIAFLMIFQTFSGMPKASAADAAPAQPASSSKISGLGQALIGEVVSINGTELVLKQEAIRPDQQADEEIQASELPMGLAEYVAVQLTSKTVFQKNSAGVPIRVGSGLLVAGQLADGKLVADFVSDMSKVAPIEQPVLPNSMTESSAARVESTPELADAGAEALSEAGVPLLGDSEPRMQKTAAATASTANSTVEYKLQGQWGFPGIHWNWPIVDIVDLGDLVKIGVWFEFNAGMGASWEWPVDANFKLPKLEVGQTSKFTVQMTPKGVGANEHTMYSTFGVGFYVHFILQALGKQYNLGVPILNFGFGNSTNKAAPFNGSYFWMDRTTNITIPIPIPKTPLKIKISLLLDYMLHGNDPFIMDSTRPSAAGAVVKDRFNYTADRHVVKFSTWDITPTATSGTIQFPEVQYAPSVNYAQLQIKVGGSVGMIPVPAFPYPPISIYTNYTLGAAGTPPTVSFTAAPEMTMEPYLPGGRVGDPYRVHLKPAGGYPFTAEQQKLNGHGDYKLSIVSGKLPKGLALDPITGVIEGTPLAPNADEEVVLRMTDSENYSKDFTFKIPIIQTATSRIQIGQFVNQPYSYPLGVKGGTAPFSWTLESGQLPPGISLNPATGILSGTPTTVGTYPMTFGVVDSTGTATKGRWANLKDKVEITAAIVPPSAKGNYRWKAEGTIADDPGNGNGMVYNTETGELMRFTSDGKTMLYANGGWQEAKGLSTAPKAREFASMAYSPKLGGIVLFGGSANKWSGSVSYNVFGDTWLWKEGAWTKISDGVFWKVELVNGKPVRTISGTEAPPPRLNAALTQDRDGNLILYGGNEEMLPAFGDTWVLSGTTWGQKTTATQPPMTLDPLMAFHKGVGKPVLIARHLMNRNTEVYEWNGIDWVDKTNQVYQAGVGPQDLYLSGAAYHQASRQLVLYGGYEKQAGSYGIGPMKQDFWGLGTLGGSGNGDGMLSSWTRIEAVGQPTFRNPELSVSHSYPVMLTYDDKRGTLMAFAKEFAGTDNQYSLSLSGLVANPAVLPADGVASAELTFQVTDGNGNPMPGRSVKLVGTGSASGALPVQTAVSNSSGIVNFEYTGTQAETLVLRIDDISTGETLGGTTVALTEPVPDADRSSLSLSETEILGDGATPATLEVIVNNINGVPVPGYEVSVAAIHSSTAQVTGAGTGLGTTGPDGKAAFTITDTTAGTLQLAVSARKAAEPSSVSFPLGEISLRVLQHRPLTITTGSLADGQTGVPYYRVLEGSGGNGSYQWSLIDGDLPPGLTLGSQGQLTGTPVPGSYGKYAITVRATDESVPVQTTTANLELKVLPPQLVLLAPSIHEDSDMKVGDYANIQLKAEGGSGSYDWTVVSGFLPKGMQLNARNGIIDGVPIESGDYEVTVQVKDSVGATAQSAVGFTVLPVQSAYVGIGTSTTEDGTLEVVSGDVTAIATGVGTMEVSIFQRNPGGDTSGTFRTANKYFQIRNDGSFSDIQFNVENVEPSAVHIYRWNAASSSWSLLPNQTFDAALGVTTVTLDADTIAGLSGGTVFAVGSPIEPPPALTGLDVNTGPAVGGTAVSVAGDRFTPDSVVLFGGEPAASTEFVDEHTLRALTPPGNGTVDVRVQNALGISERVEAANFTYTGESAELVITSPEKLPDAGMGPYEVPITAAGGVRPYKWTLAEGQLPPGLSLGSEGVIYGKPTAPGTYAFGLQVSGTGGTGLDSRQFELTVIDTPAIETTSLPVGQVGKPYQFGLTFQGSQTDAEWHIAGELPPGLSVDANGVIQGVPAKSGAYVLQAEVVDEFGVRSAVTALPLVVYEQLAQPQHLLIGSKGVQIPASGLASIDGLPELTIVSIALDPDGIVAARIADGQLQLTPVAAGAADVTVTVTESVYGTSTNILLPVTVATPLSPIPKAIAASDLNEGGVGAVFKANDLATPAYPDGLLAIGSAQSENTAIVQVQLVNGQLAMSPVGPGSTRVLVTVKDEVYGAFVQMYVPVTVHAAAKLPPVAKAIQTLIMQTGGSAVAMTADQLATSAYAESALRIDGASSSNSGVVVVQSADGGLILSPVGSGAANVTATVTDAVYGTRVNVVVPVQVQQGTPNPTTDPGPTPQPVPTAPTSKPNVAKITLTDGRTVNVDIIETAAGKYELSFPSSASGGDVRLESALLKKLLEASEQAKLRIRSTEGWLILPLRDLADSLQAYAGSQGSVTASFEKLSGDASDRMLSELQQAGFTAASPPFEFSVALNDGQNRSIKLDSFDRFLNRAIYMDSSPEASRTTVVWFDEKAGKWRPVLSRLEKEAGRSMAVFKRKGNSVYAAVTSHVTFGDVRTHWSREAVEEMASKQIVSGVAAGKFSPEGKVTRAQFATMLVRALGVSEVEDGLAFKDVDGGEWYASSVKAAAKAGLASGYSDGSFRPNQTISRVEMAVMLVNSLNYLGEDIEGQALSLDAYKVKDSVAGWARKAFAVMLAKGILTGQTDGQLAPERSATRAEAVAVLQRLLNLVTFAS